MIVQLDTENADRDLTSQVTVLTHTPNASYPMWCQGLIYFGDGTKNLDGSGGDFELTITVGGQTFEPDPQSITFSTAVRTVVSTIAFPVPANAEVVIKAKSPNAGDSDVDVTAYLYQVDAVDLVGINGDKQSVTDIKDFADTGYDPSTHKVAGVVLADTTTTNTDMRGTDSAALASDYTSARAAKLDEITAARMGALTDWINGGRLDLLLDAILEDTGTTIPGTLVTVSEYIDTEVAAIKAVTDNLPDSGALTTLLSNVSAVLADTGTDGVKLDFTQTVDGITLTSILEMLIADSGGTIVKSTSGSDIILNFKKQDGSTTKFVCTYDSDGNRTVVVS